jgi:hypothetical protein
MANAKATGGGGCSMQHPCHAFIEPDRAWRRPARVVLETSRPAPASCIAHGETASRDFPMGDADR